MKGCGDARSHCCGLFQSALVNDVKTIHVFNTNNMAACSYAVFCLSASKKWFI